ncbi:MAG TPA: hypothetical protein DCE41_06665 [Cytophagales bacterium]|nr:hypothetical protein [Cytophagales bacterium]HAA17831.1 hypothetical protein [Cytophagales bacterium]HAP58247.1 hypothetical protein [Cytophagales bacterium]
MSNFLPTLRKAFTTCPQPRAYLETLSTEELESHLKSQRRQIWLASLIWLGSMALIYFGSNAKEALLYLYIITAGSTVYLSREEYLKRKRIVRDIIRSRQ